MINSITIITTAHLGSCWCGDCFCNIFADGSIQYGGEYDWQKSERFMPTFGHCEGKAKDLEDVENREMRPYYSNLKLEDYKKALSQYWLSENRGLVKEDCCARAQINSSIPGYSNGLARIPETSSLFLVRNEEDIELFLGVPEQPKLVARGDIEHYPFISTKGSLFLGAFFSVKYPEGEKYV
jgi:hypothetical protein